MCVLYKNNSMTQKIWFKKKSPLHGSGLNKRYDIDGDVDYNFAKFINHSCNPNCEVDIIDNEIWISSIKRIKKGAELFYNYGYPFDTDFVDHICKCGSRNCVGYILSDNDWPKLKKYEKKLKSKSK